MSIYSVGDTYQEKPGSMESHGIDVLEPGPHRFSVAKTHWSKIEVHNDPELRDLILKLLQEHESREASK